MRQRHKEIGENGKMDVGGCGSSALLVAQQDCARLLSNFKVPAQQSMLNSMLFPCFQASSISPYCDVTCEECDQRVARHAQEVRGMQVWEHLGFTCCLFLLLWGEE